VNKKAPNKKAPNIFR